MAKKKTERLEIEDTVAVIRAKIGIKADGEVDGNGLIGQVKEHAKKIDSLEKNVLRIEAALGKMTDKIDTLNQNALEIKQSFETSIKGMRQSFDASVKEIKESLKGNITEASIAKYYKFVIGLFALLTTLSGFVSYLLYIKK